MAIDWKAGHMILLHQRQCLITCICHSSLCPDYVQPTETGARQITVTTSIYQVLSLVNNTLSDAIILHLSNGLLSQMIFTLKFLDSIILISAGILSPNFTSTTSPRTKSSARNVSFSPSRITVANCGTMFLNDSIIFELFDSWKEMANTLNH